MAQVDISRFGSNIQKLFAPAIQEGQVFIAYLDVESNSYTVKGDNISSGGSSASNDSVERLEQNFSSLQTNVSSLQTSVNGLQSAIAEIQNTSSSEDNSVIVVNDIIYGLDNGSLNPTDVNQLKGRPLLVNDGGNLYFCIECYLEISFEPRVLMSSNTILLSTSIDNNDVYAGFGDGKIHTISNYDVTSVALNNGDFIFNKADNALYTYDATNHKFVKASGKCHYVVDYLVDYVGKSLPSNLNSEDVVFFQLGNEYFPDSVLINYGSNVDITGEIRFANIQSILNDDASIYTIFGSEGYDSYDIEGIRVTNDLYDGDTIYNKADGCTYTFTVNGSTKSFVKTAPTTNVDEGSSLAIVDDFVYGHQNSETGSPSLSFDNLKNLKGRTFIDQSYDGVYLTSKDTNEDHNITDALYNTYDIPDGKCFAGFGDGKIHTIHSDPNNSDYSVTSVAMSNSDFILNKADNALFTYDVTNHKFIKVGSNNHFVVDMIIDYVGETPSSYDFMNSSAITDGTIHHGPLRIYDYYLPSNFCFANIQSTLSDDAEIYKILNNTIVTIHDLYDGDTVYNKADGCTYTFKNDGTTKSFVRTITPAIPPVLDIIYINNWFDAEENDSASEGDKYIYCYSKYEDLKPAIFKTYENGKWTERNIQAGECYASTNTHRIYTFQSSVFQSACFDIPIGASFFNKADNSLYVYDGTDYIKIGSNS